MSDGRTDSGGSSRWAAGTDSGRCRLNALDAVLRGASRLSVVEPEVEALGELVGTGAVCFDIGAAYGMYSLPLARLVGPAGEVHSFEPQRKPHRILTAAAWLAGARNLRVTRAALGSRPGTRVLAVPTRFGLPIHGHAHVADEVLVPESVGLFRGKRSVSSETFSVDRVRRTRGLNRIDFMKIDVEGYESAVLEGAEETLEKCRPKILMEIEQRHLARYGTESEKIIGWLRDLGYRAHVRHGGKWEPVERVTAWKRNYLFTPRAT
ncbi:MULTISPECIES: FkbM family methyltransferase [unclassified Actinopolyspora]|uniref:FkbM family methyltransferase n=1 Tax=unclassified Actinopolyspora TaxID=2639451 RepID=UPI0013F638A3|nr:MULTISPECIES: FkbM family methyltransferase [unclassified Actinopolyspora]NHD18500.1 FkbM family methyltransferase [Actinopolyspora sp. BKK2]NHE77541.1 FkbM family methyltransferase [Actinopolyspora sp. BKK1]